MNEETLQAIALNAFVMTEVEVESYTKSELEELRAVEEFEQYN